MKPDQILKQTKNPRHISGIYNYCDRWCERCNFTSRCLNYDLSNVQEKELKQHDLKNNEFWEELMGIFESTLQHIKQLAAKEGINLSMIEKAVVEKEMKKGRDTGEKAMKHPISSEAKTYFKMVDEFFEKEKNQFEKIESEMNSQLQMGVNEKKIRTEVNEIKDISEIINWYNPQIWVKLMRALNGKFENEKQQEGHSFSSDSDGSAKVALVGIDRSMAAWGRWQQLFPEKTDDLITILLHLDKLRKQVELFFPKARSFTRPGFDD